MMYWKSLWKANKRGDEMLTNIILNILYFEYNKTNVEEVINICKISPFTDIFLDTLDFGLIKISNDIGT